MSEPNSLYLRVRLSREAYQRYLESPSADARDFSDWMDWLGKVKMSGGPMTPEKIEAIGASSSKRMTAKDIQAWTTDNWAIAKSEYDDATETWRFGILQFSENYYEFLEYLPVLRAVDRFKDRAGVDFLLVHNFLWFPDYYIVCFEFAEGKSVIAGSPGQGVAFPKAYAEEAARFLAPLLPGEE